MMQISSTLISMIAKACPAQLLRPVWLKEKDLPKPKGMKECELRDSPLGVKK
jgi:hypothetical protein